jgi:secreted trypsin-like serine protease
MPHTSVQKFLLIVVFGFLANGCEVKKEGYSSPKIIGGDKVDRNLTEGPVPTSVLGFTTTELKKQGKSFCTGTLIDRKKNIVVTAAHCFVSHTRPEEQFVYFGTELSKFEEKDLLKITKIVLHSKYEDYLIERKQRYQIRANDLALVYFEGSLPAKFDQAQIATEKEGIPKNLLLAGFGITGKLHYSGDGSLAWPGGAPATHNDTGTLRQVDSVLDRQVKSGAVIDVKNPENEGKGSCGGDSGGPLFGDSSAPSSIFGIFNQKKTEASWKLYGVLSTGVPGGIDTNNDGKIDVGCSGKSTYTDLRYYSDWLAEQMSK